MINLNRIQPELYVGTYPQSAVDIARLKTGPRVTAVVNLQTEADFAALRIDWGRLTRHYLEHDIVVQRWPIRDFDPQDLRARLAGAVDTLEQLLAAGHRAYVHCTAGVCRAPSVAIAYLAWCQGWELDDAYRYVRRQRTCDPYLEAIQAAASDRLTHAAP